MKNGPTAENQSDYELICPVQGCQYTHTSPQWIARFNDPPIDSEKCKSRNCCRRDHLKSVFEAGEIIVRCPSCRKDDWGSRS